MLTTNTYRYPMCLKALQTAYRYPDPGIEKDESCLRLRKPGVLSDTTCTGAKLKSHIANMSMVSKENRSM